LRKSQPKKELHDHPGPGAEQKEGAGHREAVVEDGDAPYRFGELMELANLL